jgi:hypothetical protein
MQLCLLSCIVLAFHFFADYRINKIAFYNKYFLRFFMSFEGGACDVVL